MAGRGGVRPPTRESGARCDVVAILAGTFSCPGQELRRDIHVDAIGAPSPLQSLPVAQHYKRDPKTKVSTACWPGLPLAAANSRPY